MFIPTLELASAEAGSPRPERTGGARGTHWWLERGGEAVAYARTVADPRESVECLLLEIEVREDCRGEGLSAMLLDRIRERLQLTVYTDGNWTEAGAKALLKLPLAPGFVAEVNHARGAFVASWQHRTPRYP